MDLEAIAKKVANGYADGYADAMSWLCENQSFGQSIDDYPAGSWGELVINAGCMPDDLHGIFRRRWLKLYDRGANDATRDFFA